MNKKLLALAVAAALAPAAAMADSGNVSIYGVANMAVEQVGAGSAGGNANGRDIPNFGRVSSHNSFLGFKGSEDLGNGTSAVWQIEQTIVMDGSATGTFNSRNTFLGLSGKSWGTALMGQHDTPYKLATGKLDIFADTLGDYNSIIGTSGTVRGGNAVAASAQFDRRTGNTIAYVSPTVNGMHAAVGYVFGENPTNDPKAAGVTDQQAKAWSLMGMYDNGPLFVSLAWEKHYNLDDYNLRGAAVGGTDATDTATGTKLGAGYKFGDTKVGFVWEKLKAEASGNTVTAAEVNSAERTAWHINLAHQMGANTFKVAYSKANKGSCGTVDGTACVTDGLDAHQWTVGVDHAMSKRTNVYALWTQVTNSYNDTASQGNRYSFGVNPVAGLAGSDPRALSLGLRHSF